MGDIAGDITALGATVKSDLGLSHYNSIDVNHPGFSGMVYTDALRGTVSDNLGVFGDIYDGINNAADEVVQHTAAKASGIPALNYVGNIGGAVRNSTLNGATRDQAMNLGLLNLGADFMNDQLLGDDASTNKVSASNLAKQSKSELEGQIREYGINHVTDKLLDQHSNYTDHVNTLIHAGLSQEEARERAYYAFLLSLMP